MTCAMRSTLTAQVVPLGIHGDDAGGHGPEKVLVITWGSVAVDRPTMDSRICFAMLRDSEAVSGVTREKLYQILTWSFNALAMGCFPAADENGTDFGPAHHPDRAQLAGRPLHPGGMRGAWSEMRGDWKFLRESLHLHDYYNARNCCHLCAAKRDHPSSCEFGRDATVRSTCVNGSEWIAGKKHSGTSPLLSFPGFNIWRVQFDIMHTLDLGILQHAIPSALQELCAADGPFKGPTIESRVQAASAAYHKWCRDNHVTTKTKRISLQWVQGPWPRISQVHCKAAPLRRMVEWIMGVCTDVAASTDDVHVRRRAAFFISLHNCDSIMRSQGRFLDAASAAEVSQGLEDALSLYHAISKACDFKGVRRWPIIPKHHALSHIGFDHAGTNPRQVHCDADEDMVGKMKRIYIKCHGVLASACSRSVCLTGCACTHVKACS